MVSGYKAAVTRRLTVARVVAGASVWQRNYYEHVIRNEEDLARIRHYIADNPSKWALDRENPIHHPPPPCTTRHIRGG